MFWDQRECAPLRVERVQNERVESETKQSSRAFTRASAQASGCFRVTQPDHFSIELSTLAFTLSEPRLDLERHHLPRIACTGAHRTSSAFSCHCKSLVPHEAFVSSLDVVVVVVTGSTNWTRNALE